MYLSSINLKTNCPAKLKGAMGSGTFAPFCIFGHKGRKSA